MNRTLALVLTLSCATSASAIVIRDDTDDVLYHVDEAEFPQLVDLIEVGDCLGTLITRDALLTVAHCAVDLNVGGNLSVDGSAFEIASVTLHPQWDDEDAFDIAVVQFTDPVPAVEPLFLYRGDDELGEELRLLGRGTTANGLQGEQGGQVDGVLRGATNVVTSVSDQFIEVIFEAPGQAGITTLEGVGAAGDSGGPVLIETSEGVFVAGLNSYGEDGDNGVASYGARDYQTRVSRFVDWVETIVDLPEPNVVVDAGVPEEDAGEIEAEDAGEVQAEDAGAVDPPFVDAGEVKVEDAGVVDAGPSGEAPVEIPAAQTCSDVIAMPKSAPLSLLFVLLALPLMRRAKT